MPKKFVTNSTTATDIIITGGVFPTITLRSTFSSPLPEQGKGIPDQKALGRLRHSSRSSTRGEKRVRGGNMSWIGGHLDPIYMQPSNIDKPPILKQPFGNFHATAIYKQTPIYKQPLDLKKNKKNERRRKKIGVIFPTPVYKLPPFIRNNGVKISTTIYNQRLINEGGYIQGLST